MKRPLPRLSRFIRNRSLLADPREAIYIALVVASDAAREALESVLARHRISAARFLVLRALASAPRGLTGKQLGSRVARRNPDLTRLLDRLGEEGLILRARSDRDRRKIIIQLTPRARSILLEVEEPILAAGERILAPLTTEDRLHLLDLLDRFVPEVDEDGHRSKRRVTS